MIPLVLLWCMAAAQNAPAQDTVLQPQVVTEKNVLDAVWNALRSDPQLANHHRGYLAYLDAHPQIAQAEEAFSDLMVVAVFREAASRFDESLNAEPNAQTLFDRYYACLAKTESIRYTVDRLSRLEFEEHDLRRDGGVAMAYLRAHPDRALLFLENPARLVPLPEALAPLLPVLKAKKKLREDLLEQFRHLDEQAPAHAGVFPWWQAAGAPEGKVADSYRDLMARFERYPHEYWIWHRRWIALAADSHARDWIRYWHRRVHRQPALARAYPEYLKVIRQKPEWRKAAFDQWEQDLGPAPPWPPDGNPPTLAPMPEEQPKRPGPTVKEVPKPKPVAKPAKPGIPMPKKPDMPKRPAKPTKSNAASTHQGE